MDIEFHVWFMIQRLENSEPEKLENEMVLLKLNKFKMCSASPS